MFFGLQVLRVRAFRRERLRVRFRVSGLGLRASGIRLPDIRYGASPKTFNTETWGIKYNKMGSSLN